MTTYRVAKGGRPRKPKAEQPKPRYRALPKGAKHFSPNARDWYKSVGDCEKHGRLMYVKCESGQHYLMYFNDSATGHSFNMVTPQHIESVVREGLFTMKESA